MAFVLMSRWESMMGNDQRELFPHRRVWQSITPGDWLSIEHEGKTVVGMIYRQLDEVYKFVYWENLILRCGHDIA